MDLHQRDIDKFNKDREISNPLFWSRFTEKPLFQDATFLDIGCGWGSLCIDLAMAGASKVFGLDIKQELIDFANKNLQKNFPELTSIVEFRAVDLKYFDEEVFFDYILSKDSFEHIIDVSDMLHEITKRLRPGGKLYVGFGPLYTSPYGDHDRRRTNFRHLGKLGRALALIPWGHLFMEPHILRAAARHNKRDIISMHDLGLNKMCYSDFRKALLDSGLSLLTFDINQSTSIQSRVASSLMKVFPFLKDYLIHNIYCILKNN